MYPKHLTPIFKRKTPHNPKPKKYKHEITWEEGFGAKITEEVECECIEREKNLQQREHKVDQREYELEMKQKCAKDNTKKIIRQPLNRDKRDLFHQVQSITREEIFPKIKFITNQEQLDEFENPKSLGYYFVQYCKKNCPTAIYGKYERW